MRLGGNELPRSVDSINPSRGTYAPQVTRAAWPDPLFDEDLALILGLPSADAAEDLVLRENIRHLRVAGRLAVRATALAEWLTAREIQPGGAA